jgi:hypothetical protein
MERWFAELTTRKLRRSAHRSVTELDNDIRKWINEWNKDPGRSSGRKSADDILETVAEYCHRLPTQNTRGHAIPNAMGFRHLGVGARFRVLVTVGSSWLRACRGPACRAG